MTDSTSNRTRRPRRGAGFWIGQLVGVTFVAVGIRGLLDAPLGAPPSFVRFFLGAVVVHDFLVAPLVFAGAWLLVRLLPDWAWPPVRNGLFVSIALALFSYPFVRGFGRRPQNTTILPRNYAEGLLIVLTVVWTVTIATLLRSWIRRRAQLSAADTSANSSRISSP